MDNKMKLITRILTKSFSKDDASDWIIRLIDTVTYGDNIPSVCIKKFIHFGVITKSNNSFYFSIY